MDCAKSIMCRLCAQGAHFVQEVPRRCPLVQIGLLEAQDSANAWWSLNTSHTAPDTRLTHYSRTTLTLLIHCAHTRVLTLLRHCAWHTANTLVLTLQIKSFALYKLHKIVCQSFVWLSDWLFKVVHFTSCIRLSVRQTWRTWKCVDEEILVINDDDSEFKWWEWCLRDVKWK